VSQLRSDIIAMDAVSATKHLVKLYCFVFSYFSSCIGIGAGSGLGACLGLYWGCWLFTV